MSQIIAECPIWKAIFADERLARARRKLSFHEIRLIIDHALASVDGRRMAETGTGSGRSPTSAVAEGQTPETSQITQQDQSHAD